SRDREGRVDAVDACVIHVTERGPADENAQGPLPSVACERGMKLEGRLFEALALRRGTEVQNVVRLEHGKVLADLLRPVLGASVERGERAVLPAQDEPRAGLDERVLAHRVGVDAKPVAGDEEAGVA